MNKIHLRSSGHVTLTPYAYGVSATLHESWATQAEGKDRRTALLQLAARLQDTARELVKRAGK